MSDIEIEIDGRKINAKPGQMVIQAADDAGVYIPRFCYHKHLSIAANCRMCLVEVEKAPKPLPACATPATPGMKIFTKSEKTIAAQRSVMEFLLINHPLDCPICDQGGECELQDLSMGYGSGHSEYDECKRSIADQDLGPLIATDMTRCIYCTRCVRFGSEIAGVREMGATFRGEDTEIGTYVQHTITSEVSGNIIDLCPVGALTSKPYRFTARAWELSQAPGVSPHDCLGTNINVHTRYGKVMRVVSRDNKEINQTWISDRDRFSYTGLYHAERLQQPKVKVDGQWRDVTWQHALEVAASGLHAVVASAGAEQLGALASPSSTLEEFYLLQKLMRGLGSSNIDYRLRESDMRDQNTIGNFPGLSLQWEAISQCDAVILIGSHLTKEQPLVALRVRDAVKRGAAVAVINPVDYEFNFDVSAKEIVAPQNIVTVLTELVAALKQPATNSRLQSFVTALQEKKNTGIFVGALAMQHPAAAEIRYLASELATLTHGHVNLMTTGANAAGAWLAGAIPHRKADGSVSQGLSASEMLTSPRQGYLLLNTELELDANNAAIATKALAAANFVVAISMYANAELDKHANVILPMAAFTETSGTYINATGHWQTFTGSANAFGEARPGWKILRVLANFLQVEGFEYESSDAVRDEVRGLVAKRHDMATHFKPLSQQLSPKGLTRIGETPIYDVDALTRHAAPLQTMQTIMLGDQDAVRLHPETAKQHGLVEGDNVTVKQGEVSAVLPLILDERIAKQAVWVAGGRKATALGGWFDQIEIQKA